MKRTAPTSPPADPPAPRRGRPPKHGEPCERGSYYLPVRLIRKARRVGRAGSISDGIAVALECLEEAK